MKIIVLAERFEDGQWKDWEHICNEAEIDGVADTAMANAVDHMHLSQPAYIDYLDGVAYIFNVARGTRENPKNGDVRVYAAIVNNILIGINDDIERHFRVKLGAA